MGAIISLFIAILMAVIAVSNWEKEQYYLMAVAIVLGAANFLNYAMSIKS